MSQPEITVDQITLSPAFEGSAITNVDSDKLNNQIGSFYQNANNLNAGTVPTGRLSGTYTINISGSATTCTTASNSNALGGLAASGWAKLASPAFTGNPTAPTVSSGDNDSTLATTAFVHSVVGSGGSITKSQSPALASTSNNVAWLHGLGAEPDIVSVIIQCKVAEYGYAVGDRLMISLGVASWQTNSDQDENAGMIVQVDTARVYVRRFNRLQINMKSSLDTRVQITYTRWDYYIKAMVVS